MYSYYGRRYVIKSIFSRLVSPLTTKGCYNDVASILVIKHVACPYCSSIYSVVALASNVCGRIEKNPFYNDRSINEGFRETHLGNPIECTECSNTYIIFAAIERDKNSRRLKDIHVKVARHEEPYTSLMRWPHMGLVGKSVIVYDPEEGAMIYDDFEHYMSENKGDNIATGTIKGYVPELAGAAGGNELEGGKSRPPKKVKLG
ncbi:MAG: hypothetical protein F7B18_03650 [Desulfurococcales archaeon]|nr:hypothetical protein [Desulfurococcales archaeon]